MADVTYPPLDVPKSVADDVWVVDSGPLKLMGMPIPLRMTVLRLPDGGLLLNSPTHFNLQLKSSLERIGPIAHLVAPNTVHWSFMKEWQAHCPGAMNWGAPGLRKRPAVISSGLKLDRDLADGAPAEFGGEVEVIVLRGAGFAEGTLFHRSSRTLVLTDLVVNVEPKKLPPLMALGARLVGSTAPDGKAPVYARMAINAKREQASAVAQRLVALEPERVIFAHGAWFEQDGAARLRNSLGWLLP